MDDWIRNQLGGTAAGIGAMAGAPLGPIGLPIGALAGWAIGRALPHPDPTSFTSGGGVYKPGGLAPEGIDKNQDSLTQATRALSNYTGQKGQDLLNSGETTTAQGLQGEKTGEDQMNPVMDFFHKLMSGDRGELASAMQPEADQISNQFGQIRQMFSQTGSRGGGSTSTLAASPYDETRQLAELTSKARMGAAGQEGNLAMEKAKLGLGVAGVGLGQEGAGTGLEGLTQQTLMARRGQNMTADTANRQMATQGIIQALI
jgi:hypothetical protein